MGRIKPYWNAEFKTFWNEKRKAERRFLKSIRQFSGGQALQLGRLQSNNPQQLWK